jgi:hypothetical protein
MSGQVGYSGLVRFAGFVLEEFLVDLQGRQGRRLYREIIDNDSVIGAIMFAFTTLIRQVDWAVVPDEGLADDDDGRAEFIDSCFHDMVMPWPDKLSEIITFLPWGWAFLEQVYKRRDATNSRYPDGRIGWHDWALRGQESLLKWEFDDQGNILGMWQLGPPSYREVMVPMEKSLLFRTSAAKNNPEGRSIIRNAFLPWLKRKYVEQFEGIGIERDLAGIPYLRVPGSILSAQNNANASPGDQAAFQAYQQLLTSIRQNEQSGIMLPSDLDPETKQPLYSFELIRSAGTKQFDTNAIITRLKTDMAQTVLADFIQLGHTSTGSRSLGQSKSEMFTAALRTYIAIIESVVNDVAIPRLLRLNGMPVEQAPMLKAGDIERQDLDNLGTYVLRLAQAGIELDTRYDSNLTADLLSKAGLPDPPEDDPRVLNEPTAVYDQQVAEDVSPDDATAMAPPAGSKRKPQRAGQPPLYANLAPGAK